MKLHGVEDEVTAFLDILVIEATALSVIHEK